MRIYVTKIVFSGKRNRFLDFHEKEIGFFGCFQEKEIDFWTLNIRPGHRLPVKIQPIYDRDSTGCGVSRT
jgi:hypothetical protein